jgi:hypothetical protein
MLIRSDQLNHRTCLPTSPPSPTPGARRCRGLGGRGRSPLPNGPADAPQSARAVLGARRHPSPAAGQSRPRPPSAAPSPRLDGEVLAAVIGTWLADPDRHEQHDRRRRAVAVDGKTLRGARRAPAGRPVHLLVEPDISDHPCQPGTWPDACGYVDDHGWTCGYSRAEHTHISGEESTSP